MIKSGMEWQAREWALAASDVAQDKREDGLPFEAEYALGAADMLRLLVADNPDKVLADSEDVLTQIRDRYLTRI